MKGSADKAPANEVPVTFGRRTTAHEWFSFEDETADLTWVFDITFLQSRWTCVFGSTCEGVLTGPATELVQGCCSYGAHFVDEDDRAKTEAFALRLSEEQWQFKAKGKRGTTKVADDGALVTKLVDDACIFLNRPGFDGGPGCALHRAALDAGERPLDWKPAVCWQLPLRREDSTDDRGHTTATIRQWDRRHWGEGGEEFHWWCTDDATAFVGEGRVVDTLADELIELTTPEAYAIVASYCKGRVGTALPHPAVSPG